MGELYEYIRGKDIITPSDEEQVPLIEGMLHRGDHVLFIAEEKIGKTIFSQQLACALSSGEEFLGTYDVPRPCRVWYMFNEVRKDEIKDRFRRISHAKKINVQNITLIPFRFRFNTPTGFQQLQKIVQENQNEFPDVVILDSLYKAVKGTLKNDDVMNEFNHIFGDFAGCLGGCARIVIHHLTKPGKDESGKFHARTDKDSYGSAFLLADVDHCFRLEKWGDDPDTKERILKCDTQRSGNVTESIRLTMIEPDPLYYEYVRLHVDKEQALVKLLNKFEDGLSVKGIVSKSKMKRSVLYEVLGELKKQGVLEVGVGKDGRTKVYRVNKTPRIEGGQGEVK